MCSRIQSKRTQNQLNSSLIINNQIGLGSDKMASQSSGQREPPFYNALLLLLQLEVRSSTSILDCLSRGLSMEATLEGFITPLRKAKRKLYLVIGNNGGILAELLSQITPPYAEKFFHKGLREQSVKTCLTKVMRPSLLCPCKLTPQGTFYIETQ